MQQIFWYEAASNNLNKDLVAYFKFENNVVDSTGLLPSATGTGIDFVSGKVGQAVRFDANLDRIDIPDTDLLSFTTGGGNDVPFSISFWYYTTALNTGGNWFINKRTNVSGGDEWQILLFTDGKLYLQKFDRFTNGFVQSTATSSTFNTLNTWFHVVVTYDGSKSLTSSKIYVNGSLATTSTTNIGGAYSGMNNGGAICRMGLNSWDLLSPTFGHRGYMDELAIWKNRLLTPSDVSYLYNLGNGRTYPII